MKRIRIVLILLVFFHQAYSQNKYAAADHNAGLASGDNIIDLHKELINNLSTDEEKVRAFYTWIALNIQYDVAESLRQDKIPSRQEPVQVLKTKKAICHGYSALFNSLCGFSGIPCYLVSGYIRLNGKFENAGHTWNMVYLNDKWHHIDATWGAGGVDSHGKFSKEFNEKYFLPASVDFLSDHYPFDPMWQLVLYPVKLVDYKSNRWVYEEGASVYFNYNDTIINWELLDSLDKEYTAALRMLRFGPDDPLVKEQFAYAIFGKGNAEFDKGNKIMSVLFPRDQTLSKKQDKPAKNSYKTAQLDSIEAFYKNANFYYRQIKFSNPSESTVLKNNQNALKFNMDVVKREKARITH